MLKQSQLSTDKKLKQMGVSTRLEMSGSKSGSQNEEVEGTAPLFILHEDGKRISGIPQLHLRRKCMRICSMEI